MLKSSMIALTLAASLGGAFVASVAPASADDGWYWRHHEHRHHEWRDYDRYDRCRTVVQRYRVWTHYGPEWVVKRIRVCD